MKLKNNIARFSHREEAGRRLAEELDLIAGADAVALSNSLNGMPVAIGIANTLNIGFDLLVQQEKSGQEHEIFRNPFPENICSARLQGQYQLCTGRNVTSSVRNKCLIITDDGCENPESLIRAIRLLRTEKPSKIIVALPVGAAFHIKMLDEVADETICLLTPVDFISSDQYYDVHQNLQPQEVRELFYKLKVA